MKIYISGKIGEEVISDATRLKFAEASDFLADLDLVVFNPSNEAWQLELKRGYEEHAFPHGIPANSISFYEYVLLRDLMVLSLYDAIYLLSDWEDSPGAKSEYAFALATKKRIFFEDRVHAVQFLEEQRKESYKTVKTRFQRHKYVDLHLHEVFLETEPRAILNDYNGEKIPV